MGMSRDYMEAELFGDDFQAIFVLCFRCRGCGVTMFVLIAEPSLSSG